jgi:hypothetical protein
MIFLLPMFHMNLTKSPEFECTDRAVSINNILKVEHVRLSAGCLMMHMIVAVNEFLFSLVVASSDET